MIKKCLKTIGFVTTVILMSACEPVPKLDNPLQADTGTIFTGTLAFLEDHIDNQVCTGANCPVDGLTDATYVVVSPDGFHVYVAGTTDDEIAIFSRDRSTGLLTYENNIGDGDACGGANCPVNGLNGVTSLVLSSDSVYLYAAGEVDDRVSVYSRDSGTGLLTFIDDYVDGEACLEPGCPINGLNGAASVAMDPSGTHLYVAGNADDRVAVFTISSSSGELTFVDSYLDGEACGGANCPVNGLNGARTIVISPDGNHAYVTGDVDDALSVFSRDASTGELTYVNTYLDGAGGVDGLNGAYSVVIDPSGSHVYASGNVDDAIAAFSRDSSTGELTFIAAYVDNAGGINGLDGVRHIYMAPDGQHVYAAGEVDDAVVVFTRNSSTGALTFLEVILDGGACNGAGCPVNGINGARGVTMDSTGHFLYTVSNADDALSAFRRN